MSSINKKNLYIPYREDDLNQRSDIFFKLKKYYEDNGFNVIELDSGDESFNVAASKNLAFEQNEDVICILNADTLINVRSLNNAIDYCQKYECIIKPFKRHFLFNNLDFYIDKLSNDELIDSFNYHSVRIFYSGAAWIIYNKSIEKFNENILDTNVNNIEYLIRSSINSKTIFTESDCYSLNHAKKFYGDTKFYLDKIINMVPDDITSIYKYNDKEENKLSVQDITI